MVKYASFASILLLPHVAQAGDLSAALEFVQAKSNSALVGGYIQHIEKDRVSILGLLEARDVPAGKAIEDYDCIEDGKSGRFWTAKYSLSDYRLMTRRCVEAQFSQKRLRGYQTLGKIQLHHRLLKSHIRSAAQAANISEVLVREIITLSSGFRPGVVSDDGKVGLMQLHPHIAERFGANNPFDAVQNIRAGANYLSHLISKWDGSIPFALAEYHGASEDELAKGSIPKQRKLLWWVQAISKQNEVEVTDFPEELGWENIALVASWLN